MKLMCRIPSFLKPAGLLAALLVCLLCSCTRVKDIKITSVGVESVSPRGFRAADAVLAIGIDNPAFAFTITDLAGMVKYNGEEFALFNADRVDVQKKSVRVYDVPCSGKLSDNVSLSKVLALLSKQTLEGFTADVSVKVYLRKGVSKTLTFKDLDLQRISNE